MRQRWNAVAAGALQNPPPRADCGEVLYKCNTFTLTVWLVHLVVRGKDTIDYHFSVAVSPQLGYVLACVSTTERPGERKCHVLLSAKSLGEQ